VVYADFPSFCVGGGVVYADFPLFFFGGGFLRGLVSIIGWFSLAAILVYISFFACSSVLRTR